MFQPGKNEGFGPERHGSGERSGPWSWPNLCARGAQPARHGRRRYVPGRSRLPAPFQRPLNLGHGTAYASPAIFTWRPLPGRTPFEIRHFYTLFRGGTPAFRAYWAAQTGPGPEIPGDFVTPGVFRRRIHRPPPPSPIGQLLGNLQDLATNGYN